jgi:hypothetical protein
MPNVSPDDLDAADYEAARVGRLKAITAAQARLAAAKTAKAPPPSNPLPIASDEPEPPLAPLLPGPSVRNFSRTVYITAANVPIPVAPGGPTVSSLTVTTPANTSTVYVSTQGGTSTNGFPIVKSTAPFLLFPNGCSTADLWVIGATVGDSITFIG